MPTQVLPLEGIDKAGVIMDSPAVTLPPGAWTNARNVRFDDGAIRRMGGQEIVFNPPGLDNIKYVRYWENPNVRCYVVINGEDDGDHAYLIGINGDAETVVSDKGTFTTSNSWDAVQYNGGYSIIINNAIDAPHHISVRLGGSAVLADQPDFEMLPGWESYASGTVASGFLSVAAEILVPFGNLLCAAALTERTLPQLAFITDITVDGDQSTAEFTFDGNHNLVVGDKLQVVGNGPYTFTWTVEGDGTALNPNVDGSYTATSEYNQTYEVTNITSPTTLEANADLDFDNMPRATALGLVSAAPNVADLTPLFQPTPQTTSYHVENADGSTPDTEILRDLNGVVRTSSVAPPGSIPANWDPFALGANTADEINLADAGKITSVRELRGNLFVYTSDSITQLRVSNQGLTAVPITKEYGALVHSGVFSWKGSHIVVGSDDIYVFQGNPGDIKSIADGRIRDYFYDQLDVTKFRNMQFVRNQLFDEIWLCYPTSAVDDETLNEALVWDYTGNTWTIRDLPERTTSIARGPIPGEGTQGMLLDFSSFTSGGTALLTVTTGDGRVNTPSTGGLSAEELATGVANTLDGQTGFSARQVGETVVFNDSRLGKNPWTLEVTVDGGEPLMATVFEHSGGTSDRPWPRSILNEAQNFILMSTPGDIQAAELNYELGDVPVFFERYNFHLTPTKDTEVLSALYILTEGGESLRVILTPIATAGEGAAGTYGDEQEYLFDMTEDYKIDTRITSRLIKLRFEEAVLGDAEAWAVAGIDLEVGKRGTR